MPTIPRKKLTPSEFGAAIRMHRERAGLTQAQAAGRFLDLARTRWTAWEAGTRTPPAYAQEGVLKECMSWPTMKKTKGAA